MTELTPAAPVFRITVTPDELTASLKVSSASLDQVVADLPGALAYLAAAGITYGINNAAVERALATPGEFVLVAQGRRPIDGLDGRLEVEPALLEIGGRPRVAEDGAVDLFDLNLIHTVAEGQVLAKRIPPVPGEPGVTVRGRILVAHRGQPAPGSAGRGTRLHNNGAEIVATVAGHAVVLGDQISVSSIYQVRGDVGVATGHVDFVGSVVVRGDVRPGYRVQAEGDVEVHGNVNGGTVKAGGNLSVRYGILSQAHVVAAGTARAKFVEYSDVRAGAEVWVSDGIVQSTISAGTTVEVLGRYGSIVGGHVFAKNSLSARELGSPRGIRTAIAVGANPELVPEARKLAARQDELARQMPLLVARISYFQHQAAAGRLNRRGAQELESAAAELQLLKDERKVLAERQQVVDEMLGAIAHAFVDARDICHADVSVNIGANTLSVRQAIRSVRFRNSAHLAKVEMTSLDS
ncbi:MAG TPA: FapA family protein [Chloroflexota bacterium]|nr:FapA family protein [Chloroflexota bacterium]